MNDMERIVTELAEIRKTIAALSLELEQAKTERQTATNVIIQGVVNALAPHLKETTLVDDDMVYLATLPAEERKKALKHRRDTP